MALTCARCGAQNPDGNLFCQNCGTQLAVAAAAPSGIPGPPPGLAAPTAGSSGYQSPYFAPTGPAMRVHRSPWTLIIAGVVALTVVMAGCGTALAIIANRNPANTSGGGIADVPSPTPAGVTPSPIASPASTTFGATTESNNGLTVKVPAGWAVASKDSETIVLTDPNGQGSVTLASGTSSPTQTAQQNKDTFDAYFKSSYPDSRNCPGSTTTSGTFSGVAGISWTQCFTLTSGAHSFPAAASLFAGANGSGNVYYIVMVLTRQDNLQNYLTESKPVLQSAHWKLS